MWSLIKDLSLLFDYCLINALLMAVEQTNTQRFFLDELSRVKAARSLYYICVKLLIKCYAGYFQGINFNGDRSVGWINQTEN